MNELVTARLKAAIENAVSEKLPGEYHTKPTGLKLRGEDVLFGLDGDAHLHLLLPVKAGSQIREDRRSEGVRLVRHELVEGGVRLCFADLECTKPYLHATFHSLAQEIIDSLNDGEGKPDEVALSVLASWRELLDRPAGGPLSREKLGGLFAELCFLESITDGLPDMLAAWTGPIPQRHDFSFESGAVEVKASLSSQKADVQISGIEQLVPPEGGRLFLLHMRLEEAEGAISVPDKVDAIVRNGVDRKVLLALLGKLGYYLEHQEEYRRRCFRVIEIRRYRVEEGFPRLTKGSFLGGTPPKGVESISYSVNLQMAGDFEVASEPWSGIVGDFRRGIGRA